MVAVSDEAVSIRIPRNLTGAWGSTRIVESYEWPVDLNPKIVPTQAQLEGYRHLLNHRGAYLCLPPGGGKTATAAAAAHINQGRTGKPTLICTLRSLAPSWRFELTKLGLLEDGPDPRWTELRTRPRAPSAIDGVLPDLASRGLTPGALWVFAHPEILEAWAGFLAGYFGTVILDEAHLFGNPKTQRSRGAIIAAASAQRGGGSTWALSGTPLTDRLRSLWTILQILEPGAWGTKHQFRVWFCGAELKEHGWADGDATHQDDLKARLAYTMFARTRSQLGFNLPQLSHQLVAVDGSKQTLSASRKNLDIDPVKLVDDILRGRNLSTRTLEYLTQLKLHVSAEKVATTVEWVKSLVEQGEAPIVFVAFRETAQAIDQALKHSVCVTGSESQGQRQKKLDAWRTRPRPLIATYDCLGVGQNLQEASSVIHHDLTWTPATHIQATARAWRRGQTQDVTAYYVFARGTLDEVLARALVSKMDLISGVDEGVRESEYQSFADLIRTDDVERWVSYIRLEDLVDSE